MTSTGAATAMTSTGTATAVTSTGTATAKVTSTGATARATTGAAGITTPESETERQRGRTPVVRPIVVIAVAGCRIDVHRRGLSID
jgi:hypothetical protein